MMDMIGFVGPLSVAVWTNTSSITIARSAFGIAVFDASYCHLRISTPTLVLFLRALREERSYIRRMG